MAASMFEALRVFRANGMTMRPFFVLIAPYVFAYLAFINPWLRFVAGGGACLAARGEGAPLLDCLATGSLHVLGPTRPTRPD